MLGVMAALSVPALAEIYIDRRIRTLGPERLVRETLALLAADPTRVGHDLVEAHVQITRGLRMADPRFWARMKRVEAPTLVIHGELDRLIPLSAARDLVRRRPDWTLKVLEGVGHVPMMETPDLFVQVVNHWLAHRIARDPATVS